jgi:hypothetical protein
MSVTPDLVRRPARYFFITDQARQRPLTANRTRFSSRIAWRLMAGNNRPLGRSWTIYPSLEEVVESARQTSARADELEALPSLDPQGAWRWVASLDGSPVAASVVRYPRRLESERAIRQFIVAIGTATIEPTDLRLLGPSALRVYEIGDTSVAVG